MKGLRWWRRARGLTQQQLAEASGVERSHLAKIERGEVKEPRTDTLLRLAAALGVEVFDLLIGEASIGIFGAPADLRRSPAELRRNCTTHAYLGAEQAPQPPVEHPLGTSDSIAGSLR